MEQVLERPLLGYGFGFEEHVFADRYAVFNAQRPENAYVGTALQIGLFGLALLIALIASLALAARPLTAPAVAPFAGAVLAGLVVGLAQSFVLAAGSSGDGRVLAMRLRDDCGCSKRDERKVEATERHREPRLHVVGRHRERVHEHEHDDGPCGRRPAHEGDPGAHDRCDEEQPVDHAEPEERDAVGLVPVLVRVPEEEGAVDDLPRDLQRLARQPLAILVERTLAHHPVRADDVARMRSRVGEQLPRCRAPTRATPRRRARMPSPRGRPSGSSRPSPCAASSRL